jgi:hypothetical protein
MNITERDRNAPWWHELKAELESRLAKLREENDKPSTAEDTAHKRGQIEEIKNLIKSLGMGKPRPKIDNE